MDFSNLLLAPMAAIISIAVIALAVLMRPRSEERALVPAFVASLLASLMFTQPWGYTSLVGLREGMTATLIFTGLGFALGALFALILIKVLRFIRVRLL